MLALLTFTGIKIIISYMINNATSSISSLLNLASPVSTAQKSSSSSDVLSSFQSIMSSMMMNSSSPSMDSGSSMGMGDMMAPIMLMLLEKMIEEQLQQSNDTPAVSDTSTSSDQTTSNNASPAVSVPKGRPVSGVITQEFHPGHNGLDFGIVVGTPIKSTMGGKVISAGWNNQGYGNLVIVENGAYRTYYAHLSSIPVSVGDNVKAGSTIGLSGNTGNSTGPHLHYEIRKNNIPIDPTLITLGENA